MTKHFYIFAALFVFVAGASADIKRSGLLTTAGLVASRKPLPTKADALQFAGGQTIPQPRVSQDTGSTKTKTASIYLSALSQLESGNNDFAHGRHGEISRFQCLKAVWRNATAQPYAAATNAAIAATVTLAVIRARTGCDPSELTPAAFARAWHCPSANHLNHEQTDYVTRFINLCEHH